MYKRCARCPKRSVYYTYTYTAVAVYTESWMERREKKIIIQQYMIIYRVRFGAVRSSSGGSAAVAAVTGEGVARVVSGAQVFGSGPRGSSATFAICHVLRHGIARIRRFSRSRPRALEPARARTGPMHLPAPAPIIAAFRGGLFPYKSTLRPHHRQQSTSVRSTEHIPVVRTSLVSVFTFK